MSKCLHLRKISITDRVWRCERCSARLSYIKHGIIIQWKEEA